MRRHFLFPDQEHERGVGDGDANLLRLWLDRRAQLLRHAPLARLLALFWDLAKDKRAPGLSAPRYAEFFARVALALLQSVNSDGAPAIALRDWVYDSEGGDGAMPLELFREAVLQVAELVLPVESDESMFESFFLELRECVATVDTQPLAASPGDSNSSNTLNERSSSGGGPASDDDESSRMLQPSVSSLHLLEAAATFVLRPLREVTKIRGAFLQKMPPGSEQLKAISALAPPNSQLMSLKQLLLSYNPRKFALSRKFSSLFAGSDAARSGGSLATNQHHQLEEALDEDTEDATANGDDPVADECLAALVTASAPNSSRTLNLESEDDWDAELAAVRSLEQFPALRVAVVGPPHSGKTRVSKMLAQKLRLRYFSIGAALEDAITRKRARAETRAAAEAAARAIAAEAAPHVPEEAASGEAEAEGDDQGKLSMESEAAEQEPTAEQVPSSSVSPDPPHEEDELFSDADRDALFSGSALPRPKCLEIFVYYAKKTLLEGVGIVMDDVHPAEIEAEIGTDYLVALSASQDDIQQQVRQFAIAPTSRRVYSARERAILDEDAATIETMGFADFVRRADADAEGSDVSANEGEASSGSPESDAAVGDAKNGGDTTADADAAPQDDSDASAEDAAISVPAPPEPTQAERNGVESPGEPTLSIHPLLMESFLNRYRDYSSRVEARIAALAGSSWPPNGASQRYHLVHVLASQSLCAILDHCARAITGSSSGIARNNVSRRAVPVTLPEEVASASSSRANQVRWLLCGDWSALSSSASDESVIGESSSAESAGAIAAREDWSLLPSRTGRRRLSMWREFCPVSSSRESGLVLGDPKLAVAFSGRVYLVTSQDARDAFCAHPLQYLRKMPEAKPFSRVWLVSSGGASASLSTCLPALADSLGGLRVFDAISVLSARSPMAVQMELMEGKSLSAVHAAEIVADAIRASSGDDRHKWVVANLPFAVETIAALKERDCLPEVVVVLEPSQGTLDSQSKDASRVDSVALTTFKSQLFQSALAAATEGATAAGVIVKSSLLHEVAADTAATLKRQLDPLAPRIDSVDDGHVNAEDLAAAFVPSLPPEGEDGNADAVETAVTDAADIGETNRFCPVSWTEKRTLAPGLPDFVAALNSKFYCFAGARELDAFARNPLKYVPAAHSATASLVPVVVLLGVRGAGVAQLAKSVSASNSSNYSVVSADLEAVNERLAKRLRIESLRSDESQRSPLELYTAELKAELQWCETRCRSDRSVRRDDGATSNTSDNSCDSLVLLGGLGADEARLPSPELLQTCFQQDVFPLLVIPIQADVEQAVQAQLRQWRASLPEQRKKLAVRRALPNDSESGAGDSDDAEPEFDLEAAEAEETQRLQEQYQADQDALDAAIDAFRTRGVAIARPIASSRSFRQSASKLSTELDALVTRKNSLFETTELISSQDELTRALATGELTVGKHGTTCPVTRVDSNTLSSAHSVVVYRERVYFLNGTDATAAFRTNPSRFVHRENSIAPTPKPTCCVAGAPLVGKTRFALALAAHYKLVYVSPKSAIDWQPEDLQRVVQRSNPLMLDPGCLFLLEGDLDTIWRRKKQRLMRSRSSEGTERSEGTEQIGAARELLAHEFAGWQSLRLDLLSYWSLQFGSSHVQQIHATRNSLWSCLAQARERLDELAARTRAHRQDLVTGRPARVDGVLLRSATLRAQNHPVFRGFCPVELAASRYVGSWATTDRQLCVQHGDRFVWLASAANLQQLVACPAEFLGADQEDEARVLLAKAPLDASLLSLLSVADCEFPELKGYCPVTFKLGNGAKDWASIVPGLVFHRATYSHKVYFFASEEMRRKFLLEPALYASQKLPVKLPPQLSSALAKNFPGKLEQELSGVLNECLLVLGSERPKFLRASSSASACVYLALLLKARTKKLIPESTRRALEEKKLAFERDCRLGEALKAAVTPANASCGAAVKGVRAVLRDANGSAPTDSLHQQQHQQQPREDILTLCQRFDTITGSSSACPSGNAAAARASFLEYTAL